MDLFLTSVSIPALLLSASYQFLCLSYLVACFVILFCFFFFFFFLVYSNRRIAVLPVIYSVRFISPLLCIIIIITPLVQAYKR
jgi:hypothetical protein